MALMLALGSAVTAFAITIVVDGTREAAWDGSGGQMPGTQTDANESGILDNVDISNFQWTNASSNMYFLIEVQTPPVSASTNIWALICLDTDNNSATGSSTSNQYYDNCNNQTGFERFIKYSNYLGGWHADVYDSDGTSYLSSGSAAKGNVIEMSVPLADLFGAGTCPSTILTVAYLDGGDTNNDDNTPDSGTVNIGCGTPTAITLDTLSAQSSPPYLPLALAGMTFVAVAGAGLALRKRYLA